MKAKKTRLLSAELEMIAETLASDYCRQILREAAERLHDLERIAEFYREEVLKQINIQRGRK